MKKQGIIAILVALISVESRGMDTKPLEQPPSRVDTYGEIAVIYYDKITEVYDKLTPEERVFAYDLYRASLPGHQIALGQFHRKGLEITTLLEKALDHKDTLSKGFGSLSAADAQQFMDEVPTYLVYMWANHGQYFLREFVDEKRTPQRIGLEHFTQDNLTAALQAIGHEGADEQIKQLAPYLFDETVESTRFTPGCIDKSAINFYAPGFTDADFDRLSPHEQKHPNGYYSVEERDGQRIPKVELCKVGGRFDQELSVTVHWLEKAAQHAAKYPETFDTHITPSLNLLCEFFRTGDEETFKKHSIEWLQTKSKIDYLYGFIEAYDDPKSYRGTYEAEATIKCVDMEKICRVLPSLEANLPFPDKFKRENLYDISGLPNASVNTKISVTGFCGPLRIISAYCLPNYAEIRAQHGSKQIMYAAHPDVAQMIDPELYRKLFSCKKMADLIAQHDPEQRLLSDLFMAHVILHETLGHGSGRLDKHTFVEGDPLTIDGVTHKVGDEIQVTSANIPTFFSGYDHTLEELRAEIIALVAGIMNYDSLAEIGLFGEWHNKLGKEKMKELLIYDMSCMMLRKMLAQTEDATEIAGDHARANMTIAMFLADRGGIEIVEEQLEHKGKQYTVVDVKVVDTQKAFDAAVELAQMVQEIKSTADGVKGRWLIDTYGKPIRNPEHLRRIKSNYAEIVGPVKVTALIFPYYNAVVDPQSGDVVDAVASWPSTIVEQFMSLRKLALSTEVA